MQRSHRYAMISDDDQWASAVTVRVVQLISTADSKDCEAPHPANNI